MAKLDWLESRLQTLIEDQLIKYLPGFKTEDRLARQLAAAMHNNLLTREGIIQAPNIYVIAAHPSTLSDIRAESQFLEELANALSVIGDEAGFKFILKPAVTIAADTNMKIGELHILASFSSEVVSETQGMTTNAEVVTDDFFPENAFLILQGEKNIPLTQTVINIGRRLDNQIIIDDARVSRNHAQIRVVKGRFVIFDLNSTGGTYVNGQRISQTVLCSGDVISLAGVSLIFGQDLQSSNLQEEQIEPSSPLTADNSTLISLTNGNDEIE